MQMSWRPLSKKPGLHTTSAVPQTDHLHATPNSDSNSSKRSPYQVLSTYTVNEHTFLKANNSLKIFFLLVLWSILICWDCELKLKKVVYFVQFLIDFVIIKFSNIRSFSRIFKDQTCVTCASLWPHITRLTRLVLLFISSFHFHLSHCRSIKAGWAFNRKWLQTATCHSIHKIYTVLCLIIMLYINQTYVFY